MGWWRQLGALLRKNFLIKWRSLGTTCAEILLPVLIMLVIVGIRTAVSRGQNDAASHLNDAEILSQYVPPEIGILYNYQNSLHSNSTAEKIAFIPGTQTTSIVQAFKSAYPALAPLVDVNYETVAEMESYMAGPNYGLDVNNPFIQLGVSFQQFGTSSNPTWSYTIHTNVTQDATQGSTVDTSQGAINTVQVTYNNLPQQVFFEGGVMFLQNFIDTYILEYHISLANGGAPANLLRNTILAPFPTPAYVDDQFANFVGIFWGLLFAVVFLWPVTRIIKVLVEEKENRIKEGMKMMGLDESIIWLSWLITYFIIFLIMSILLTIVSSTSVFKYSDKGLIFFFFFIYSWTIFAFCFLLSCFFSSARTASTFGALVFLGIFFAYYGVNGNSTATNSKTAACLSAPACFALGATAIIDWEATGRGFVSGDGSTLINNFAVNTSFGFFILDFVLYMLGGLYFSRVIASDWGTPLPWYFPLMKSFWFPPKINQDHLLANDQNAKNERDGVISVEQKDGGDREENIEPVADELKSKIGVKIRKLRKEFVPIGTNEPFVAVNDLDLDMYEGQILCLLGHNGAGKTTTINMLSGLMAPTSGAAMIYGHSIDGNMESIRKIMGVCPQHDILFDQLTVKEHLELYCRIKDVPADQINAAVADMIQQVGLTEKVNERSSGLSGGMKRKLSVGIALIGDSKIVYLDEPTSGMDPYSRRATWDLLKKKKEGRVIILTTHFMDEADGLGDRIGIMAKGKLQCCGSSLFLKGRYGVGYSLTITKREHAFNLDAVDSLIHRYISDAESLSDIAGEVQYRLPLHAANRFADLFDEFDQRSDELGIQSYGISVTTLEEVFLRVGHDLEAEPKKVAKQASLRRQHSHSLLAAPVIPPQDIGAGQSTDLELEDIPTDRYGREGEGATRIGSTASAGDVLIQNPAAQDRNLGSDRRNTLAHRPSVSAMNRKLNVKFDRDNMMKRHFVALMIKRFTDSKRNKRLWVFTILIPFLILIVGFALVNLLNAISHPQVSMSYRDQPWNFPNPVPYYDAGVTGPANPSPLPPLSGTIISPLNSTAAMQSPELQPGFTLLESIPTGSNVTGMNDYLVNQLATPSLALSRYGALVETLSQITPTSYVDDSVIFFNTTAQYGMPAFYNLHNNILLQAITGNKAASIGITNRPVPQTQNQAALTSSLTSIFMGIAFAFIPASFIHYSVGETTVKSKHQQMISGVSAWSYWSANWLFDYLNYLVPAILCLICLAIYNVTELIGSNSGATILAILLYGASIISFTYMMSFLFSSPSSAQNVSLILFILIGAFLLIASFVLDIIPSTQNANKSLKFIYRLFPSFCFGEAIANIVTRSSSTITGGQPEGLWDMNITGYPMIFMTWEIFVYFGVVMLIEYIQASPKLFTFFTASQFVPHRKFDDEDEDVMAEKSRLMDSSYTKDMITIKGMRKVYATRAGKAKIAVHDLYLGIPEGQCFGFLGINGAGKTTTLKMMTNDIYPSDGAAWFNQIDIMQNAAQVRRLIGYCPQFDALIGTLTGREHLALFARIKGVDESILDEYVENLIIRLGLQEGIADRMCRGYSGGNKRKLCVGIALIGNPKIVFLDEPSTGMDPGSKRFMWDLISATMRGRSVILTTHSMEECEALCQRLGIMVGGRLKCLGTTAHLKERHGDGYQIDCNVHGAEGQQAFTNFVKETWNGSELIEWHDQSMKFRVPKTIKGGEGKISIGSMFRVMEAVKEKFSMKEYSVSETSLEQIFISFARTQEEEQGTVAGLPK